MLLVANVVALLVTRYKQQDTPVRAFWAGYSDAAQMYALQPPPPDDMPSRPIAELRSDGAYFGGRRVPVSALVTNMGRATFLRRRTLCGGDHYCEDSPWTSNIVVANDTPISAVIATHRAIRALCSVEVNFFVWREDSVGETGMGWPFMLTTNDDPKLDRFGYQPFSIPPYGWDETLLHLEQGESLDQFGERTGCARVSPLGP